MGGNFKWMSAVVADGNLYGLPYQADCLLVCDMALRKVSYVSTSAIPGSHKWMRGATWNGKVYGMPFNAECLLVFDTLTGEVTSISTSAVARGDSKWAGAVAVEGMLYGIPYD